MAAALAAVFVLSLTAFAQAMKDPAIVTRLAELGYLPIAGGPSAYADNLRSEIEKWGKVVRSANIKAE